MSNLYDPYILGYTRVTMILSKRNKIIKKIRVNL